eukprot:830507-Pelagomonas_calceolata.AAC.1
MAHPVVESHGELGMFGGLPSKPCLTRLSRSVSLVGGLFVPAFLVHKLVRGLVGLDACAASQQPPIEDASAHGSFCTLQRILSFQCI